MPGNRKKLGDLVKYDVDGGKPARNPATIFGFDLVSPLGRRLTFRFKKDKPKRKRREYRP